MNFLKTSMNKMSLKSYNNLFNFSSKYFSRNTGDSKVELEKRWRDKLDNFNQNWKQIKEENNQSQIDIITKELGEERVEYIKTVAEFYSQLNSYQLEYINNKLKQKRLKLKTLSAIDLNTDWPSLSDLGGNIPPVNPNYFKQQELMSEFTKFLKTQEGVDIGFGAVSGSASSAPAEAQVEVKKEVKEEVIKEKPVFDVMLVGFDAAKKITLIKEVRALLSLGLKESKELVDTVPQLLIKGCKKEDYPAIKDKLEAVGGKLETK